MPQSLNQQLSREQQIAALEKDWAQNPRWKSVKRNYSAADVQAACEMLGYDVLQVANEGKMVAVVPAEQADAALAAMRAARYGENAAIIGRVLPLAEGARPAVRVRTGWGSTRILDMLVGEQLPRIC